MTDVIEKHLPSILESIAAELRMKADDYNTAVIAHVIKEKVSGNGVDMSVLESEMQKWAYNFALQMTDVLEKHLPVILESFNDRIIFYWCTRINYSIMVFTNKFR